MNPVSNILNSARGVAVAGSSTKRLLAALVAPLVMAGALTMASADVEASNNWQSLLKSTNSNADRYNPQETLRSINTSRFGVVFQVREVSIEDNNRVNFGGAVGAAAGTQVGKNISNSTARTAARSLSAALGGVVGSSIQQRMTRKKGYEIMVLEQRNGRDPQMYTVVQQMDHPVSQGDVVGMAGSGSKMRLIEIEPNAQRFLQEQLSGRVPEIANARQQQNQAPSPYQRRP